MFPRRFLRGGRRPYGIPRRGARRPRWLAVALIGTAAALPAFDLAASALARINGRPGCRVTRVVDGDTVRVHCRGRGSEPVRLIGYDTPEIYSPRCPGELWAGIVATWALQGRILAAEEVELTFRGSDRYDRRLAVLRLDGRDAARVMVEAGHARPYDGGRREGWC